VKSVLLLTGRPGSGKTALIKEALARTKVKGGGFYTEEIRTGGTRQGFRIATLDGQEAILVSKYKVHIGALEGVGVSALRRALAENDLTVIDEIGKMELLSPRFREVVTQAMNSGKKILGTIMLNHHPFADEIKRHPQAEVLLVTSDSRTEIMKRVLDWIAFYPGDI